MGKQTPCAVSFFFTNKILFRKLGWVCKFIWCILNPQFTGNLISSTERILRSQNKSFIIFVSWTGQSHCSGEPAQPKHNIELYSNHFSVWKIPERSFHCKGAFCKWAGTENSYGISETKCNILCRNEVVPLFELLFLCNLVVDWGNLNVFIYWNKSHQCGWIKLSDD